MYSTIDVFARRQREKKINSNHIDHQNLQQNHFKSAMLLPSCAFVVRNVHLCQSLPHQSHKSAHRSSRQPSVGFQIGLL